MNLIVSSQNYLNAKIGINKFIKKYYKEHKEKTFFLTRKNIKQNYEINNKEISNLNKFIEEKEVYKVHIHSLLDTSVFNGFLKEEVTIPITYFCHSLIEDEIECWGKNHAHLNQKLKAQKEIFEKANKLVFLNEYHKEKALKIYSGIKSKSEVFRFEIKKNKKRGKQENLILYVGRISIEKGILDLAKAFEKFNQNNKNSKLIIVGDIHDSKLTKELTVILGDSNYELIEWIYDERELNNYYQKAKLVVVPSHIDSMNLVILESLENRCNLLISDIPNFKKHYSNDKNISFFKTKDTGDLLNKLILRLNQEY